MKNYIKLLRPHHYIKNILIFFPLVFSGDLFDIHNLFKTFIGFVIFSLLASVLYIINDLQDKENDCQHSTKSKRPLASGAVSTKEAIIIMSILVVIIIILSYFFIGLNIAILYLLAYFILNIIYSMGGKNIPILDIAILVSGFVLRLLFGASLSAIEISGWLYLTITAIAFYLSLGKRRNELARQKGSTRKVLKYYNHNFLDKNMYVCLALAITFYSLWTIDPLTIAKTQSHALLWTVPLVIIICMKYTLNIEGDSEGDPVEVILKDKVLLALTVILAIILGCLIYF